MSYNEENILKEIVMKTMDSVDNLAIQVAELNTTLRDNVLDDIRLLKKRADQHRQEIDEIKSLQQKEEIEKKHTKKMLNYLYIAITGVAIPVIGLLISLL